MLKIRLDKTDILFSQFIRLRDKRCVRCKSPVQFNDKGLPNTHQASHYFGRANESTRFDVENVDCLCWGCHEYWGSTNRENYRAFKIKQLGEKGFKDLQVRANMTVKKDRKLAYLYVKKLMESL